MGNVGSQPDQVFPVPPRNSPDQGAPLNTPRQALRTMVGPSPLLDYALSRSESYPNRNRGEKAPRCPSPPESSSAGGSGGRSNKPLHAKGPGFSLRSRIEAAVRLIPLETNRTRGGSSPSTTRGTAQGCWQTEGPSTLRPSVMGHSPAKMVNQASETARRPASSSTQTRRCGALAQKHWSCGAGAESRKGSPRLGEVVSKAGYAARSVQPRLGPGLTFQPV